MHPAGNMAAPHRAGKLKTEKTSLAATNAATAVNKSAAAPSKYLTSSRGNTYTYSNVAVSKDGRPTSSNRAFMATGSSLAQPSQSYQGYSTTPVDPKSQDPLWFILLKDKEVKVRKQADTILSQQHAPIAKKILKGSLLQGYEKGRVAGARTSERLQKDRRTEGQSYFTVKVLIGDVEFECTNQEIARIAVTEKDLLMAISTDTLRFNTYQDTKLLSYAISLQRGSSVLVKFRNDQTSPFEEVGAVVRYIGPLKEQNGTRFGVELMEEKNRGHGTSDGEFGKIRHFQTDPDCALFVPISKLIPHPYPGMYEEISSVPKKVSSQPKPVTWVGDVHLDMAACFEVGNSWKCGKVVFITVPPGQNEHHIAIEMPTSSSDYHQTWDGYWDKKHLYTPREGVHTHFIPAKYVIPEHFMQHQADKQPSMATREPLSVPAPKEKNKAKKSSEPFFIANNKPRKSTTPAIAEKIEKSGPKTRHDISDSYFSEPVGRKESTPDDFQFHSGHYADGSKPSFVDKVKGKIKSTFNNGSKDDEPSKTQWYSESAAGVEGSRGYMLAESDYLEDDVVDEITNVIHRDWRTIAHSLYLSKEDIDHVTKKGSTEKERTVQMLRTWQKKRVGFDNVTRLATACRTNGFMDLADDLEQGLDEELLMTIAYGVSKEKLRPFGLYLNISEAELDKIEQVTDNTVPQIRMLLSKWRIKQSRNSDKILLLSNALEQCGLRQLALEVARGLDDDIMLSFAIRIGFDWKILAKTLRLSLTDIKHLEDFSLDKQPYQMLMLWRKRQPRQVDVLGTLSKGLREAGLPHLAKELVQGVDEELVYTLATLIGDVWEGLALRLGISHDEITALKSNDISEIITIVNMLNKWRERHDYTRPRFAFLMDAVRDCGLGMIADSFDRDRQQRLPAEEEKSAKNKPHTVTETKLSQPDVSREILVKVSKQLDYGLVCAAMNYSSEMYIDIENHYQSNEQRVFAVLDCWRRRGDDGKRSVGELLQIVARVGGNVSLIDDVMRTEATDKKGEERHSNSIVDDFSASVLPLDHEPHEDTPVSPDLEVNSMVEFTVRQGTAKRYGVIRWIGIPQGSNSPNVVAGIELESSIHQGATDGTFNKIRYFQCEPNKAMFVYLDNCRPDSRFPSQSQTFQVSKRQTSQDFGGFASPMVEGFIDPPPRLQHNFVGMEKGIQGDQNSCYLDTTLFSMFAYNNVFDPLLRRSQGQDDLQLYAEVQKLLREGIVNPLREYGFVRADRVLQLREHLDNLGTTKGLMSEEKDPEEFLHTLLNEVFKSKPLLKIRHGGSQDVDLSNIHQIFMDKDESYALPTVEQLLLQSFQEHDLKLVDTPPCLIVQMPRFGKEYKMYSRIVPSLQLDVTNIIEGYQRQCSVCGNLAVKECTACKKEEILADTITHNYCTGCYSMMHSQHKRSNHKPVDLPLSDMFLKEFYSKSTKEGHTEEEVDSHRQIMLTPKLMELFAVICIRTSHYVAFVKAGRESDSEWVFFDSMADRQGDQQGYNIPQITHLKDFNSWVNKEHIKQRVETKQLTGLMERLLGDAYICMYSDTEKKHMTYV